MKLEAFQKPHRPITNTSASQVEEPSRATKSHAAVAQQRMRDDVMHETFAETTMTPSSGEIVHRALYIMKGMPMVQEHKQDDATLQILRELPLAYQIDQVVARFLQSGLPYPTPDVIGAIIKDLINENVIGHDPGAAWSPPYWGRATPAQLTDEDMRPDDVARIAAVLDLLTTEEKVNLIDSIARCLRAGSATLGDGYA